MSSLALDALENVIPALPAADWSFAQDLIRKGRKYGLSEKQLAWVQKLTDKATGKATDARKSVDVGNLSRVVELFDNAAKRLKFPAIVLAFQGDMLRLRPAGERAKVPGSLNVIAERDGQEPAWLGRIYRDGRFELSPRFAGSATETAVVPLLRAFAADPATGAKESARLTGRCVFCNGALKDERSTAVGYGRTCAANFGLPWGAGA